MERISDQIDAEGTQLLNLVMSKIIPGDRESEIFEDCIRFIRLQKLKKEEAGIRARLRDPALGKDEAAKLMQRQIEIQKLIKG